MDEKPKSSVRRVQLLWLVFILIQLAAYLLVKWLFDVAILLYLVGLNLIVALVRIKKEPIFPVRWGFRLALLLLLGVLCVVMLTFCWHFVHFGEKEEMGLIAPNPAYAQMVAAKLTENVFSGMNAPNEVYIWRNTGRLEEPLRFPRPALFWFNYNMAADSFTFYQPDTFVSPMPAPSGWKEKLKPVIPALLEEKKEWGWVDKVIQDADREFRVRGKIYPDEPRVIAVVNDMDIFFEDVRAAFRKTAQDIPLLDNFTTVPNPEAKNGLNTPLVITFRDSRDSVIAQLGSLGNYQPGKSGKYFEYSKNYPFKNIGATMEVIIPHCLEKGLNRYTIRIFILFVIVWSFAMLMWVRAEMHLNAAQKKLAEKEVTTPTA